MQFRLALPGTFRAPCGLARPLRSCGFLRTEEPVRLPDQSRDFIGTFLNDYIGSSAFGAQTDTIRETTQQDDGLRKIAVAKFRYQRQTIHGRHFEIGYDKIEILFLNPGKGIRTAGCRDNSVAKLFQDRSAS
jgi:hypothetical protein